MNWKADQSQAGTMLDKSIKSSNIFKAGDWLGNIFILKVSVSPHLLLPFYFW
jgi:S-DNA-T family DNA segregation ATPase FtsK/SpoIIIE